MTDPAASPQTDAAPARRRPVLRFLRARWQGWRVRHQLPFNFALHLVGIPLAFAGLAALLVAPFVPRVEWYWGAGGLVVGYLLQYVGHRAEGNDVGEWAAVKRLLGLPYVGVAPRWQQGRRET
jgi:uncharacterized membrane protein YGL010W